MMSVSLNAGEVLDLDACIAIAEKKNPGLQQSAYGLESSQLNTKDAYNALLPGASLTLSSALSGADLQNVDLIPGGDGSFSYNAGISQTIYTPGLMPNLKIAKLNEENSRLQLSAIKDVVRTTVANLYYSILSSKALIRVYDENIRLADENIKKIRTMYELGTRTESDVLKSEVQKGNFVTQQVNEQQNLMALKRSLNLTLGRQPDMELLLVEAGTEAAEMPDLKEALGLLKRNNPELQQAKLQKEMSELSVAAAKQGYLPSVSANYSYNGVEFDEGLDHSSIGISASVNLFNRFHTKSNIQRERIKVKQAEVSWRDQLREKEKELSDLYTRSRTFDELIRINETTLESSQRDLEIVMQQYQIGSSTILDQMNAQLSVLNAQSNLVKLKYSKKILEAQINQLTGQ